MRTLTGGQAVVEALATAGVEHIFGIVGVHTMHIYDALYNHPFMRQITARHEQGAAFMADGYARASGRVGVTIPITGPGGTNAATGIAQAYADSSPVLVIQSTVAGDLLDREVGTLHEMKDQSAFFRSITQRSDRLTRVEAIPGAIRDAIETLQAGRPRPIHLEIPADLLAATGRFDEPLPAPQPWTRPQAEPPGLDEAIALLRRARRPVIYAGGGVISSGASSELVALAETLQAPVVTTVQGLGSIPADHPLSLGNAWSRIRPFTGLAEAADLVLAVGTRLSESNTAGWQLPLSGKLIVVDVDVTLPSRHYPVRVGLQGDARMVLSQLLRGLEGFVPSDRREFLADLEKWRAAEAARVARVAPQAAEFLRVLRATLERNAILVNDMTMPCYWAQRYFPVYEPRTFLFPYYFGTLGFSLPAAIGAKLACPERQVVSICGDGGFLFTCQDLATAVQLGLSLPVVVFNDNCYSGVKAAQDRALDGRYIGVDLVNPDFVALGAAFGARSCRVEDLSRLGEALSDAFAAEGPSLIEVPFGLPSPRTLAAAG